MLHTVQYDCDRSEVHSEYFLNDLCFPLMIVIGQKYPVNTLLMSCASTMRYDCDRSEVPSEHFVNDLCFPPCGMIVIGQKYPVNTLLMTCASHRAV